MRAIVFATIVSVAMFATAQKKSEKKLSKSAELMESLLEIDETVPKSLLERSEGIIIIPGLVNAGFLVGGKRGKGIATIFEDDGTLAKPVFVQLTGGSIGFQAGVQSIDLVLLVKSKETLLTLGKSDFTLGGDISVAAGPIGRNSSARTNEDFSAEIISYSKSKGLFAGISLDGALLKVDKKLNRDFYGKKVNITLKLSEEKKIKNDEYTRLTEVLAKVRQ